MIHSASFRYQSSKQSLRIFLSFDLLNLQSQKYIPPFFLNTYMLKVNNRATREKWEVCSELTIKTPEQHQRQRPGVFVVNWTNLTPCSSVSIVSSVSLASRIWWVNQYPLSLKVLHWKIMERNYHYQKSKGEVEVLEMQSLFPSIRWRKYHLWWLANVETPWMRKFEITDS